jgi:OOP family OmpA-OmpF porin
MVRQIRPIQAASIAIGLCAVAGAACAQTAEQADGLYLGLGVGGLHSSGMHGAAIVPAQQQPGLTVRITSAEDKDTGWKLYAGDRLGRHWAVEGGYTALGRYSFDGQVVQDPGTVQTRFKADDWNLAALAILPLDSGFEVFGKAGAGYWTTRLDTLGAFSGRSAPTATAHGFGPVLGLGASWRLSKALSARVDWEHFAHIGQADRTGRADIDFASIGLQYHF